MSRDREGAGGRRWRRKAVRRSRKLLIPGATTRKRKLNRLFTQTLTVADSRIRPIKAATVRESVPGWELAVVYTSLLDAEPKGNVVMNAKVWMVWVGRVLWLWPVFVVLTSATWKLTRNQWYVAEFARIGWPERTLTLLAFLQIGCVLLFIIPRTMVLGAILITGYLGGAIATYVRMGEPYPVLVSLSTSMITWVGIYLRDERLRALLPFRGRAAG
jgi:hypothetical protein